jgi:hypothetical protein
MEIEARVEMNKSWKKSRGFCEGKEDKGSVIRVRGSWGS